MNEIASTERTIHTLVEMKEKDFAEFAAELTSEDAGQVVKLCLGQVKFHRIQMWGYYYLAGRVLGHIRKNQLYGEHGCWEIWCLEEVELDPSTVYKYIKFADRMTPAKLEIYSKSFAEERFSLAKALGYLPTPKAEKPVKKAKVSAPAPQEVEINPVATTVAPIPEVQVSAPAPGPTEEKGEIPSEPFFITVTFSVKCQMTRRHCEEYAIDGTPIWLRLAQDSTVQIQGITSGWKEE